MCTFSTSLEHVFVDLYYRHNFLALKSKYPKRFYLNQREEKDKWVNTSKNNKFPEEMITFYLIPFSLYNK